ncbi:N-acetylgalactosamine kinase [Schistocerca piceifrons]|uniref:N-acetylgalactosamine kinase n=1 Tax=Schistocerca piceifrons TaxID=274613 RepID=UPI001F5E5C36|nr:N-acetylgalactosamine kinase [Schistocerca piceifrons]
MDLPASNNDNIQVIQMRKDDVEEGRFLSLTQLFEAKFMEKPSFYVRVPGRVNIIGEHIDYCGYSVCPMAIQRDILMAVSPSESKMLQLCNTDSKCEDLTCSIDNIKIEVEKGKPPEWYNYFLCGVKGIMDILPDKTSVGMNVAVTGNIPWGSGLSSSSALVSAAALATAHANKVSMKKVEIAALCAHAERYIGTQGGGMDQAIAFLGSRGSAKHIEFNPLRAENIKLPSGAVFVIAHSLSVVNKAATHDYNCRVAECRLAGQIIAKKHNLKWREISQLSDLQKKIGLSLEEISEVVCSALHEEPYTKEEICNELEVSEEELHEYSLTNNTTHISKFKLRQRALHVFQEAARVKNFCAVCQSEASDEEKLVQLGKLMRESHQSLQHLFECSHPLLDEVVLLGENVTLGSRLTGAGWGGCTVALTTQDSYKKYIEKLKTNFYAKHSEIQNIDTLVFATEPSEGAEVYVVA